MKVTFPIFFLSLLLLFLNSDCNPDNSTPKTQNKNPTDSLLMDIPLDVDSNFVANYFRKNELIKLLNLDTLEKGSDSIRIRIWCNYAFKDSFQIIAINYVNENWIAHIYLAEPFYNKNNPSILDSIKSFKQNAIPISGWTHFINELYRLNIVDLPDMSKCYGKNILIADGDLFAVEISTSSKYRFYQFQEPAAVQDKVTEAKKMVQILEVIQKELGFKKLD